MSGAIMEGFICPMCKEDLGTISQLTSHFDEAHTGEDKDMIKQMKGLFDKAKRKLMNNKDTNSDEVPFSAVSDSSSNIGASASFGSGGYKPTEWEPQELGVIRSHTALLKSHRGARIDHFAVESNKLLIRLDKLMTHGLEGDAKKRKDFEKTIVPWVSDEHVNLCPSCGKNFRITRRRHHCRLCGGIMCNDCSMFMPESYALKLTNPSQTYTGFGFRRSSSIGSLNSGFSGMGSDDTEKYVRTCEYCRMLLERRDLQTSQRHTKPAIVILYEKMHVCMEEVDKMIPTFYQMSQAINAGETQFTLVAAQDYRLKIMRLYELIDALSKKITTLKPDQGELSAKEQQLHRKIRQNATTFMQSNLLGLQSLPSEEECAKLQKQRQEEIKRKIEEEKRAAQERERKKQEALVGRKTDRAQSEVARFKEREKPSDAVQKTSGWKPLEVDASSQSNDPMIQQMNIIRGYIKQAKELQKWDEVKMLEENLKMLQQEYWKQSQK